MNRLRDNLRDFCATKIVCKQKSMSIEYQSHTLKVLIACFAFRPMLRIRAVALALVCIEPTLFWLGRRAFVLRGSYVCNSL